MVEDPLEPDVERKFEADASHSLICGIPHQPEAFLEAIQDMLVECVTEKHPTQDQD